MSLLKRVKAALSESLTDDMNKQLAANQAPHHTDIHKTSLMYLNHAMHPNSRAQDSWHSEYSSHLLDGWHKPHIQDVHSRLTKAAATGRTDPELHKHTHEILNAINAQHGSPLKFGYQAPQDNASKNKLDDEFEHHVQRLRSFKNIKESTPVSPDYLNANQNKGHEINWLKKKIVGLRPDYERGILHNERHGTISRVHMQVRDLERQIKERGGQPDAHDWIKRYPHEQ